MHKFLAGLTLGFLCAYVVLHQSGTMTVFAQAKDSKDTTAKVISGGVLSGWNQIVVLKRDTESVAGFACKDPNVLIKEKIVECTTDKAIAKNPILAGPPGALVGWKIEVSGDQEFSCAEPSVDFVDGTLGCPEQTYLATLRLMLSESRAELAATRAQLGRPNPWTINVATAPPHGFACPAGFIDADKNLLTCPAVIQLF
jgi:hypothetical protein